MGNYKYILSSKSSIFNAYQFIKLPWKIHFELINRYTNTVFNTQKTRIILS